MKSWLHDLSEHSGNGPQSSLLLRSLRIVLFFVLLGLPAFAWVQYRQAQNLEYLTSQNLSGIDWDAFKLELRSLHLRSALQEAVLHLDSPQALAKASTEYNLFAAHVLLMRDRSSMNDTDDQPQFKIAMSQALAFIKQAAPTLEAVPTPSDGPALQALFLQTDPLRAQIYPLVIEAHDLRSSRTFALIEEVKRANLYFAILSSLVVALGAGWGFSAMHNLKRLSRQKRALREQFEESSFQASHDALTGLANRTLLYDQLQHAIASSRRNALFGAVIMVDLDHFKPVNDSYGHGTGDALLVEVARRLQKCVRDVDTVARIGGDEFVVLLGQVDGPSEAAREAVGVVCQKLLDALAAPCKLVLPGDAAGMGGVVHRCTGSLGVSVFSQGASTVDEVIRSADAAMYRAKQGGGNRFEMAA